MTSASTIRIGYVPLIDAAVPIVAAELGFAAREGLRLELEREASWAALRDKLGFGRLDAAHMLAGMPLAAALGIMGARTPLVVPMALGLGGNAIVVSVPLYQRMLEADPEAMRGPRGRSARALRRVIEADRAAGRPPPALACVSPVSSHYYELCYWLADAGIDPRNDVDLGIVAPPRMVEHLRSGWIDGYCVGEPWALRAVQRGIGAVVATKADIWPAAPEKVLGLRAELAADEPRLLALLRALIAAARWADASENRAELATLLAADRYLGTSPQLLQEMLEGRSALRPGGPPEALPHRHVFFAWQATFPWRSQALWLLTQMQRWGQVPLDTDLQGLVREVWRPDLYRRAAAELGLPLPVADERPVGPPGPASIAAEGSGEALALGPDGFLDGRRFDPAAPERYRESFG